jgi:hypothetical protein
MGGWRESESESKTRKRKGEGVCVCVFQVCVFITAGPIIKLFRLLILILCFCALLYSW